MANRLISVVTAPIKAAKALGAAAARSTSGKSEAKGLARALPTGGVDRQMDERMKQQAALRAAQGPKVLTPKGLARQADNKYKVKKSLT